MVETNLGANFTRPFEIVATSPRFRETATPAFFKNDFYDQDLDCKIYSLESQERTQTCQSGYLLHLGSLYFSTGLILLLILILILIVLGSPK